MSQANYIIICRGRIAYAAANTTVDKVKALSDVATELVCHIDTMNPGELGDADTQPISDLQHFLMDNLGSITPQQVEVKSVEMFALLDALEDRFE